MEILFADDEADLRGLFAMELEAELSCNIVEVGSSEDAIKYLRRTNDVKLIISDYDMPGGDGCQLYEYVAQERPEIPFILVSANSFENNECFEQFITKKTNRYLRKPFVIDELLEIIGEMTNCWVEEHDFCRVKALRFLRFNNVNCDVYLKLSEHKYVKVINENDLYDINIIDKYTRKMVEYFYIKREDYKRFSQYFAQIVNAVMARRELTIEGTIDAQLTGVSFVHELVGNMGINENVIAVVDDLFEFALHTVKKDPHLCDLLDTLIKQQDFLYEHSLLTAYVSGAMAMQLDWVSDATLQKLVIASILHDVALDQVSDEAKKNLINDIEREALADFYWKEQRQIMEHPLRAAELVRSVSSFPPDVDWIVMSHHERPDGTGFPQGLNSHSLRPFACLFIIAETFARRVYKDGATPDNIKMILAEFKERFSQGNFKKPLQGLLAVFERKALEKIA